MEDNQVKIVDSMQPSGANLPYMKIEDTQYFAKLLVSIGGHALCVNFMGVCDYVFV